MSLTRPEHEALRQIGEAWNHIVGVVGDGPTREADLDEAVFHIHALQHFVMAQSAARSHPDLYRLAGDPPRRSER